MMGSSPLGASATEHKLWLNVMYTFTPHYMFFLSTLLNLTAWTLMVTKTRV